MLQITVMAPIVSTAVMNKILVLPPPLVRACCANAANYRGITVPIHPFVTSSQVCDHTSCSKLVPQNMRTVKQSNGFCSRLANKWLNGVFCQAGEIFFFVLPV